MPTELLDKSDLIGWCTLEESKENENVFLFCEESQTNANQQKTVQSQANVVRSNFKYSFQKHSFRTIRKRLQLLLPIRKEVLAEADPDMIGFWPIWPKLMGNIAICLN